MTKRIILLLSLLILVGCGGDDSDLETEITVPVSVLELKNRPIEEFIVATGTVYAMKESQHKSEISGFYQRKIHPETNRPMALGDFVKASQEIIQLEDKEFETNIKIESQRLNLEISKSEFEKQQSLFEKGGVTLREMRNAELAYVNAQYTYDNAMLQMSKMNIKAAFDGVIVELPYYTPGTKVDINQPMATIMNYRQLYMEVNLPAKELSRIKTDQSVRVMNYTLPDDTLIGRIDMVSPAIDAATRTFTTSLTIDNPEMILRPGMFVKSEVVVAREDSALVIPKDIILSKQRGKTVFVIEKGAAQQRVITTGLENPHEVQVISGLEPNERLVTKGFETLRHRSKVKIIR